MTAIVNDAPVTGQELAPHEPRPRADLRSASFWTATQAFRQYCALPDDERSYAELSRRHNYPPTTVKTWAERYDWSGQLAVIAEREQKAIETGRLQVLTENATRAAQVMSSGVALPWYRVEVLGGVAEQIIARLRRDGVYERRERTSGVARGADMVTLTLRHKEIETLRALLDDVAAETGQRIRNVRMLSEQEARDLAAKRGLSNDQIDRVLESIRQQA